MLDRLRYVNHISEVVDIGKYPVYADGNDLRNFTWTYLARNNRIAAFSRKITKKNLPLWIACKSEEEGLLVKNRVFEVFEKDVLANQPGRIWIGDYYMTCFVTESKKASYLIDKGLLQVTLSVVTDRPFWVREDVSQFIIGETSNSEFLDYRFDYSYDFTNSLGGASVFNPAIRAANFRMVIYGYQLEPEVYVGGHKYAVYTEILNGEYLTIDSVEKTVVLTKNNGDKVNCFNLRDKESYIFQQIRAGDNVVTAIDGLRVDITLLDERSEPKWI